MRNLARIVTIMSIAHDELMSRLTPHQGDWLKKSLDVSGATAAEIAELIDVSIRTMTNYLGGHTRPNDRKLAKWAMRTGVPLSYLQTGILPEGPEGNGSRLGESNSRPSHYNVTPLFGADHETPVAA